MITCITFFLFFLSSFLQQTVSYEKSRSNCWVGLHIALVPVAVPASPSYEATPFFFFSSFSAFLSAETALLYYYRSKYILTFVSCSFVVVVVVKPTRAFVFIYLRKFESLFFIGSLNFCLLKASEDKFHPV